MKTRKPQTVQEAVVDMTPQPAGRQPGKGPGGAAGGAGGAAGEPGPTGPATPSVPPDPADPQGAAAGAGDAVPLADEGKALPPLEPTVVAPPAAIATAAPPEAPLSSPTPTLPPKGVPAEATPPQVRAQDWNALLAELEALPQNPLSTGHPRNWWFRTKRVADFVGHAKIGRARLLRRLNPYPKPFRHTYVRTDDGVRIAAWLGPQHRTSPSPWGLIVVPGMFATKDDTVHKARAIHIHRHWRIPVMSIDMRAFGESTGIATAGWKEAMDVHAAARHLAQETGVKRVAVLAESMGGAAALNALALDSQAGTDLLSGGVLCNSAFVDARDAVAYISERPAKGHPFAAAWGGFRHLLSVKSMGAYDRFDEYLEDVARVNGLTSASELYDLANPKWKVPLMRQPALLLHAMDDPVVPVRHARRMQRYAEGQPHIMTLIVPWGNHTMFEVLDPTWFWEVARRFFGQVNGVELESLAGK